MGLLALGGRSRSCQEMRQDRHHRFCCRFPVQYVHRTNRKINTSAYLQTTAVRLCIGMSVSMVERPTHLSNAGSAVGDELQRGVGRMAGPWFAKKPDQQKAYRALLYPPIGENKVCTKSTYSVRNEIRCRFVQHYRRFVKVILRGGGD